MVCTCFASTSTQTAMSPTLAPPVMMASFRDNLAVVSAAVMFGYRRNYLLRNGSGEAGTRANVRPDFDWDKLGALAPGF
jgi:hypothetical protein